MEKHLSWNEDDPNDSRNSRNKNNNNPWGDKNRKDDDGLPDLDEMFKKSQQWFKQALGGQNGGGYSSGGSNNKQGAGPLLGMTTVILAILIGVMGFYKVEPGEQSVEYRLGKYIGTQGPGPHWLLPFIHSYEIKNTSEVLQRDFADDLITKEVNIVTIKLAVQYRIADLEKYLFKVASPEKSLEEATKAAIRQVIAESTLDEVLSTRGHTTDAFMGDQIQDLIVENLKLYQTGLEIQGVEILAVLPPQEVKEAFNDAIQAQEDEIRYQNEAQAYKSKVIPVAQGQAARVVQDANAYKAQTILAAQGDVARFKLILPEYQSAPDVTRNRLYIGTMENALKQTPKIFVDTKSNNVLFLPLDKFNFNKSLTGQLEQESSADKDSLASTKLNNNLRNEPKDYDSSTRSSRGALQSTRAPRDIGYRQQR